MTATAHSGGISEALITPPTKKGVWAEDSRVSYPDIWVRESAFDNDTNLIDAVIGYVNAMHDAYIVGGEYPIEARQSYHLDYYVSQVDNGGFGQYAHNSRLQPGPLGDCRRALQHIGLEDQARIFDDFLIAMSDPDVRRAFDAGEDYELPSERLNAFDGPAITAANAAWLRSLPNLSRLSNEEFAQRQSDLTSHAMHGSRKKAAEEGEAKYRQTDPTYSAAIACCKAAGIGFQQLNAGIPFKKDGKQGVTWGMQTSAGLRYLTVVSGSHAVLLDKSGKERLATYVFGEGKAKRVRPNLERIWNILRIIGFGLLAAWAIWRIIPAFGVFGK